MEARPARPAEGDFVAWNGGCLLIGRGAGRIAPHSHYAIQWVIGVPAGLRVQFGRNGDWQSCAAALIPSRATHTIDVVECEWTAVMFIEPETPQGRAIAERLRGGLELLEPEATAVFAKRLERAWRTERSADAVRTVCLQLVHELSQTSPRQASDPRIVAATEAIRQHIDQPVTLEAVARIAHLSPSRFRHLFVEETGMPLRTYVLWRRLLHVWELLVEGDTLSGAAHAAGFADSAHLSRTARSMFGLPPSALQMNGPLSARGRMQQRQLG
ncbi:MAG TPA: AraC family transcriptional regulator [Ramlibacter sp.]|uniref:helix-turn-helix transcriptional regulator n=1 Tax=Ramlibacter sp. TaxID=1917967 RepID=UPI002D7F0F3D|nr:AraC family transcriptional regulator [Ramlibacter sp.]HET8747391.1 AraC family transcriptional regulator [Ramlibacter sp.]